ncbi:MAG: hypothetical protein KatS3mg053_3073 [Candidatus Roseilinea sp.]|nr:MAG: hypothetical protein KatS3mg053_3073 [Candidatus Roseilinea sp.]
MQVVDARRARAAVWFVLTLAAVFTLTTATAAGEGDAPAPDTAIAAGLAAWRAPDERGTACVHCHGPDGLEIAHFDFDDSVILRRDDWHLPPADAASIVGMIHALRDKYGLHAAPLDPVSDRLLQPSSRLIAGATSQERDYNAALQTFVPQMPTLFNGRVDSILKALRARNEILAFDARNQALGVPFPRLSGGAAQDAAAVWAVPQPRVPKPGSEQAWYALHDAYLANPTEANLWAIYNAVEALTAPPTGDEGTAALSAAKYRSLLLAQHIIRERALGANAPSAMFERWPIAFLEIPSEVNRIVTIHNPMFAAGNLIYHGHPRKAEAAARALPWWFAAWTFNPGLPDVTEGREAFLQALEGRDGGEPYPIHHRLVRIKMDMTQAYAPYVRLAGRPPQVNALELADASRGFVYPDDEAGTLFFDQAHRALYHVFSANVRRMQLYLLIHEFNKQCADGRSYVGLVGDEVTFVERLHAELLPDLERAQPQYAAVDRALVITAIHRLQEAWNQCRPLPPAGSGIGLFAEYFEGDESTPRDVRIAHRLDRFDSATFGADRAIFIRWTGAIEPRFSDVYEISLRSDDRPDVGFRLWLDERLLIDCWDGTLVEGKMIAWEGGRHYGADAVLRAGRRYAIRLEYRQRSGRPAFRLIWKSAHQAPEVIPQSQLYPGVEVGKRVFAIARTTR